MRTAIILAAALVCDGAAADSLKDKLNVIVRQVDAICGPNLTVTNEAHFKEFYEKAGEIRKCRMDAAVKLIKALPKP